ncbi:MAG TPA: CHAD domain-containing protein [Baekduia sp.]|nr:CHAD domain-containing protein [Baekduia sp.]
MRLGKRKPKRSLSDHRDEIALGAAFVIAIAAVGLVVRALRDRRSMGPAGAAPLAEPDDARVRAVARDEIDAAVAELEQEPLGPENVHEARRALRRLRTLLRVARGELGEDSFQHEDTTVGDIARTLSASRDAYVMVGTLDDLLAGAGLDPEPYTELRGALLANSDAELHVVAANRDAPVSDLRALRGRVSHWQLPADTEALQSGMVKVYARARAAHDAARRKASTARLHRMRRRSKDLVHASELLGDPAQLQRRAKKLTKVLGRDNDLAVLAEAVQRHHNMLTKKQRKELLGLIAKRRKVIKRDALKRAKKLYATKPKDLLTH